MSRPPPSPNIIIYAGLSVLTLLMLLAASISAEARPADYPNITDYIDNRTTQVHYLLEFLEMTYTAIHTKSQASRDNIYDYILGNIYWFQLHTSQRTRMLTDENYLAPKLNDTVGDIVGDVPNFVGPGNATSGYTYLLNHSLRQNSTRKETTLVKMLEATEEAVKMFSQLVQRIVPTWGSFNNTIW